MEKILKLENNEIKALAFGTYFRMKHDQDYEADFLVYEISAGVRDVSTFKIPQEMQANLDA